MENRLPGKADRRSLTGRMVMSRNVVHIVDTKADPDFRITNAPEFDGVAPRSAFLC